MMWRAIANVDSSENTWDQCIKLLPDVGKAALYAKHYPIGDVKKPVEDMFNYIRTEFINVINGTDWMEEDTRVKARKKANAMVPFIGYSMVIENDTFVNDFYRDLNITEDFLQNRLNLRKFDSDFKFQLLRTPNTRDQ